MQSTNKCVTNIFGGFGRNSAQRLHVESTAAFVLQRSAAFRSVLQRSAAFCSVLQRSAAQVPLSGTTEAFFRISALQPEKAGGSDAF